jgi:CPA2 family monovalent cation:H+ antiporter-2
MPHEAVISTIVAAIGLAFLFGAIANHLRLPAIVGYLLAGVVLGPFTPGMVADQNVARQLAEVGVILLLFGVGLHFSWQDLLSVRGIAVPGAVAQTATVLALGLGLASLMGWSLGAGIVFGLALAIASTVMVLRHLQEKRLLGTEKGRIAVGWLVVQDLMVILALVLLPVLADISAGRAAGSVENKWTAWLAGPSAWAAIGITLAKVAAFLALMLLVGRRVVPWVLHYLAHTGSRELFRLGVLALALVAAFGSSELFGASFALGAFFAGIVLAESELSQQAARETLPLRDAFAVLFFVSVGMLFDPMTLVREPLPLLATLAVIVLGNALAVFAILYTFGQPLSMAASLGASLSQVGEFSFILAGLGVSLKLLPETGRDLILAGAMLSILINPLVHLAVRRIGARPQAPVEPVPSGERTPEPPIGALRDHAVLIGHGRVGRLVAEAMEAHGQPYVVVEDKQEIVEGLRARGVPAVAGNAMQAGLLDSTNLTQARWFISAIPNPFETGNLIEKARSANPHLQVIARAHSDEEVEYLKKCGADLVIMGEQEIARGMTHYMADKVPVHESGTASS